METSSQQTTGLNLRRPIRANLQIFQTQDSITPGEKYPQQSAEPLQIQMEYDDFLSYLQSEAPPQFHKILKILNNDSQLQPLILQHKKLLQVLKRIPNIKAQQMLQIISAAENEMYETSKQLEDRQNLIAQLQFQKNQKMELNRKLRTIQQRVSEEESKSRWINRKEVEELRDIKRALGIPVDLDASVNDELMMMDSNNNLGNFNDQTNKKATPISVIQAMKQEAVQNQQKIAKLNAKIKKFGEQQRKSLQNLEERLRKEQEMKQNYFKEKNQLQDKLTQLQSKLKQQNTDIQTLNLQRQHLLQQLQEQQQLLFSSNNNNKNKQEQFTSLNKLVEGTGSFQFNSQYHNKNNSSNYNKKSYFNLNTGSNSLKKLIGNKQSFNLSLGDNIQSQKIATSQQYQQQQQQPPPPNQGLPIRRSSSSLQKQSSSNSPSNSNKIRFTPQPPIHQYKTPSPRAVYQIKQNLNVANRAHSSFSYFTPSNRLKLPYQNINHSANVSLTDIRQNQVGVDSLITLKNNQLLHANYQIQRLNRENYYQSRMSASKVNNSENKALLLEQKVVDLNNQNMDLKMKLNQINRARKNQLQNERRKSVIQAQSQKQAELSELYDAKFEYQKTNLQLKEEINKLKAEKRQARDKSSKHLDQINLLKLQLKRVYQNEEIMEKVGPKNTMLPIKLQQDYFQPRYNQISHITQQQQFHTISQNSNDYPQQQKQYTQISNSYYFKDSGDQKQRQIDPMSMLKYTSLLRQLCKILKQSNKNQPFVVNLQHVVNRTEVVKQILPALRNNMFVFQLNLSNCSLGDQAVKKISSHLRHDQTLRCLKIAHDRSLGSASYVALSKLFFLQKRKKSQEGQVGRKYNQIKALDISDTPILLKGRQFIRKLGDAGRQDDSSRVYSTSLDQLILQQVIPVGFNQSQIQEFERENLNLLLMSIGKSYFLRKLSLSDNEFDSATVQNLLPMLKYINLQKLFINRIGLSHVHINSLKSLVQQSNNSLRTLHIAGNQLGSLALSQLFESVKHQQQCSLIQSAASSPGSNLVDLNISQQKPFYMTSKVSFSSKTIQMLKQSMGNLTKLYLNGLNLDNHIMAELFNTNQTPGIDRIRQIRVLELADNNLGVDFVRMLLDVMMEYQVSYEQTQEQHKKQLKIPKTHYLTYVQTTPQTPNIRLPDLSSSSPAPGWGQIGASQTDTLLRKNQKNQGSGPFGLGTKAALTPQGEAAGTAPIALLGSNNNNNMLHTQQQQVAIQQQEDGLLKKESVDGSWVTPAINSTIMARNSSIIQRDKQIFSKIGLQVLNLSGNPIGTEGAEIMSQILTFASFTKQLKLLYLERCDITNQGIKALNQAMSYRNQNLHGSKGFSLVKLFFEGNASSSIFTPVM